jgi:endoglucanase Acf2
VYSHEFSENYMVGNLGMLDAIVSTWFGTANLYVQMINFLPVTAATAILFNKGYVQNQYAAVLSSLGLVEMAWRGYVVCNHAIINPQEAWYEAQSLKSGELDAGISKSQILYWISTRKGFDSKLPVDEDEELETKS